MVHIDIYVNGVELDFDFAEQLAEQIVERVLDDPMQICWHDKDRNLHSPAGVMCEIHGKPGWEVYGENHGGKYRISINNDDYVFIYC